MEVAQETALNPELSAILEQAMFAGQFDPQILNMLNIEEAKQIRDALEQEDHQICDATKNLSGLRELEKIDRMIGKLRKLLVIIELENQIFSTIHKPENLEPYLSIQKKIIGAIKKKILLLEETRIIVVEVASLRAQVRRKVRKTKDPGN